MTTPATQIYTFLLAGIIISFFWPLNMIYVFLLTRAYIRDNSDLFNSFYNETMDQIKNSIQLVKIMFTKLNKAADNNASDGIEVINSNNDVEVIKEVIPEHSEYELRRRNKSPDIDSDDGDEIRDTI